MSVSFPMDAVFGWLLASVRLLALFTTGPFFGHSSVSARIRVALAMVVAWTLSPVLSFDFDPSRAGAIELGGAIGAEVVVGLAMGFLAKLIFTSFGLLGEFISIQGGLGAARVLDPASGASSVAMAAAFQAFAMLVFLAIDGHQALLLAAAESFQLLPLGAGAPSGDAFMAIGSAGSVIFATAARLALPVTVAMMVSNAGLGLLGRAIPQLNLMTLQLPAHVAMLLLLVAFGARELTEHMASILMPWMENLSPVLAGGR